MAINVVATTPLDGGNTSSSPRTFGITAQAGLSMIETTTIIKPTVGTTTVTGVTVNGLAAEEQAGCNTGDSTTARVQKWVTYSPASGSYDVVITISGSSRCHGIVRQLTGTKTSAAIRTATMATGTGTAVAVSVASAVGDRVLDGFGTANGDTITITADVSQTEDANFIGNVGGSVNSSRCAGSHEAGAASVDMDWTLSSSAFWKIAAISVIPAADELQIDAHDDFLLYPRWGDEQMVAVY